MLVWPYLAVASGGCRLAGAEFGCEPNADAATLINRDPDAHACAATRARGSVGFAERCAKRRALPSTSGRDARQGCASADTAPSPNRSSGRRWSYRNRGSR
jgi:hypothetical protein